MFLLTRNVECAKYSKISLKRKKLNICQIKKNRYNEIESKPSKTKTKKKKEIVKKWGEA